VARDDDLPPTVRVGIDARNDALAALDLVEETVESRVNLAAGRTLKPGRIF
jgi:hypothetical protein